MSESITELGRRFDLTEFRRDTILIFLTEKQRGLVKNAVQID